LQFSGSIRKEKEGFLCIETGNLKTNFNEILTSFNIKFSFAESTMEKVESVNAALSIDIIVTFLPGVIPFVLLLVQSVYRAFFTAQIKRKKYCSDST